MICFHNVLLKAPHSRIEVLVFGVYVQKDQSNDLRVSAEHLKHKHKTRTSFPVSSRVDHEEVA